MTDLTNTDAKDNAMIVDSMTPDAPDHNPEATEATDDAGIQKIYSYRYLSLYSETAAHVPGRLFFLAKIYRGMRHPPFILHRKEF